MEDTRLAPTLGIAGAVLVVLVLLAPLAAVSGVGAIWTYYGTGAVNPIVVGLFAVISVIVLAAGRSERSAPDLAAGVALSLGLFGLALAVLWALTVPQGVVTQMSTASAIEYHRYVLVAATALLPISAGWYARALGLL